MLDIAAAEGFPADSLYVSYLLRADPEHWTPAWPDGAAPPMQGSTQAATLAAYPGAFGEVSEQVAHFACPVEAVLECEESVPAGKWPELLLHVCSLDGYGRYRTVGYGRLSLKGIEGHRVEYVQTWRPLPTTGQR